MNFIKLFSEISIKDIGLVGGKNASLGQMIQNIDTSKINIPMGFAITVQAYWHFLEYNNLIAFLEEKLKDLKNKDNIKVLQQTSLTIKNAIYNSKFSYELASEIEKAYKNLSKFYNKKNIDVAVRSSATAEDLPNASFAGQQESFLNIKGIKNVLVSVKHCMASLFTERAIIYREENNFDHLKVGISIGIQKMVRSDKASAGVMFTLDTESGFKDVVVINSAYGLGENLVKGTINPDEFHVFKTTLNQGYQPIIKKHLGTKEKKLVYFKNSLKNVSVNKQERQQFSLTNQEIIELAKQALIIENYYSELYNRWHPVDIEWAKDGFDNKLYIVQSRPETVEVNVSKDIIKQYKLTSKGPFETILTGQSIGKKIAIGHAQIVKNVSQASEFKRGNILITSMTDPDWVPLMKKAAAIITDQGGRTCHAAIVSRELGVPAIVGTNNATKVIKDNQAITVDCSQGSIGYIYKEALNFKIKETKIKDIPKSPIPLLLNLGDPETAYTCSFLPTNGVGLARIEFIITNYIKTHPMAVLFPQSIKNRKLIAQINEIAAAYVSVEDFYIETLTQGIATIAAAFYPKTVTVRFSDFKSNEYRNLLGGKYFEPIEENPMIGFRGAVRYLDSKFAAAFELECKAINKVRNEMGLKNINVMIPFVRTIDEAKAIIDLLSRHSLQKSSDFKIIMMCEVPSNVILLAEFAEYFDGFSIGSNDLTQLTLGVDRDSSELAPIFDERNIAVKKIIEMAIVNAQKAKRYISICGQGPSDFPEFSDFLIKVGINSISLNPDSVIEFLLRNHQQPT